MSLWRAGCGESRTSGSEGGPGKPISRKAGRAPRSDPYTGLDASWFLSLGSSVIASPASILIIAVEVDRRDQRIRRLDPRAPSCR